MFMFLSWLLAPWCWAVQGAPAIEVRVDPRVELVTVAARLAGFAEFDLPNSRSPYSERIEARFGELRDHPVLATLRDLRAKFGVSYEALPSLATHLTNIEDLQLRAPLDPRPERLDARWPLERTPHFLAQLRDFASAAKAAEFFAQERPFYALVERRFAEQASRSKALTWFDSFFGAKPGARYIAIVGLLCGGGNYGVGVRLADGSPEEITPVFGCWEFDDDGAPTFGDGYQALLVHELCHTYTNPLVDGAYERLEHAAEQLHAAHAESMKRQGYANARTVMYESLVRASVIRCRTVLEGAAAGADQAREELGRQFAWAPQLAELFAQFEADREHYPTFESFMPRVVEFFDDYTKTLATLEASRPKLVACTPERGATEVAAKLDVLVFEFDRAMRDQSWSIVGAPEEQPKFNGALSYDSARKVLRVPVRLEPGRSYRFWLNSETKQGFVSAAGVALAPTEIRFSTAANEADVTGR